MTIETKDSNAATSVPAGRSGEAQSQSIVGRTSKSAPRVSQNTRSGRVGDWKSYVLPVLPMAVILIAWEIVADALEIPPYFLPTPTIIIGEMFSSGAEISRLLDHAFFTATAVLFGFAIAVIGSMALAVLTLYWQTLEKMVTPLLVGSQVVPKVALAPLFIVWFGFGMTSKVLMVILISFFPVVISTLLGLRSVRSDWLLVTKSMGAGRIQELWKVRFPAALPEIFGGLKLGMTLAIVGAVVGEFVGSDKGLGYAMVVARAALDTPKVFAILFWLVALGLVLYGGVVVAERLALGRRAKKLLLGAGM